MRVWDVHSGYLDRARLLGEHRELHALLSVIAHGKRGYARHPETLRWREHLGGLVLRHAQVVAEMELRGYRHRSPAPAEAERGGPVSPDSFLASPAEQLALLRAKLGPRRGRIPLPRGVQELWAQHKYSVLARSPERYRRIGRRVAGARLGEGFDELALELSRVLREAPGRGGLRNALEHLWGYVAPWAGEEGGAFVRRALAEDPGALLRRVARLASEHAVTYVLESTALSDLAVWLGDEKAGPENPDRP